MRIQLTDQQKAQLEKQHKAERDKHVSDRMKAVLLYAENWELDQIGQVLRVHPATIRRYLEDYLTESKLKPGNGGSNSGSGSCTSCNFCDSSDGCADIICDCTIICV